MPTNTTNWSILIVDDNKANLRILGATFEDDGFVVHETTCVEDAQRLLVTSSDKIDLVLSDIQMPGLTGLDLLKWVKAQGPFTSQIPVLLITSQMPKTEDRVLGLSLGATDYLLRSLDPQELVIRVRHAIENFTRIKTLKRSLETTETLASTGRLFAASNHEIKNVSQIIKLATGVLTRELEQTEVPISECCTMALKMLNHSSDLLSEVTKMIGSIVSGAPATLGPLDIKDILNQVVSMMQPMLKSQIDIAFHHSDSSPLYVQGVSTFLKQILINLILNARDAIDEAKVDGRGHIDIRIETTAASTLEVTVKDNGVGFSNQQIRSIFEPFSSTKQLRGGTGLGLWLSSLLAGKMHGTLRLQSEGPSLGVTAALTLQKAVL